MRTVELWEPVVKVIDEASAREFVRQWSSPEKPGASIPSLDHQLEIVQDALNGLKACAGLTAVLAPISSTKYTAARTVLRERLDELVALIARREKLYDGFDQLWVRIEEGSLVESEAGVRVAQALIDARLADVTAARNDKSLTELEEELRRFQRRVDDTGSM